MTATPPGSDGPGEADCNGLAAPAPRKRQRLLLEALAPVVVSDTEGSDVSSEMQCDVSMCRVSSGSAEEPPAKCAKSLGGHSTEELFLNQASDFYHGPASGRSLDDWVFHIPAKLMSDASMLKALVEKVAQYAGCEVYDEYAGCGGFSQVFRGISIGISYDRKAAWH